MTNRQTMLTGCDVTSGATDQKFHGSDWITVLSHGSDQFSDQQK